MNKIIKIHLAQENLIRITFLMTTSCPYSCRYCPEWLREGNHNYIDLDKLKQFLEKFSARKIHMIITGGEASTHPQIKEVLGLLKELNIPVQLDSNSVRTSRFYDEVKELVPAWSFTLHPSQHKFDLSKIQQLTDHAFVLVNIAMDPDYWETAVEWYELVGKMTNIKTIPIKLGDRGGPGKIVYTQEQEDWLNANQSTVTITPSRFAELLQTHSWLLENDAMATYDNGNVEVLSPHKLIKEGNNKFTGWTCHAGNDSITLYSDGTVGWANCQIKTYSNYLELDLEELKKPVTCTLPICGCGTDIRSSKERN